MLKRILLLIAGVVLTMAATLDSLSRVMRAKVPAVAVSLPMEHQAQLAVLDRSFSVKPQLSDPDLARALALQALRSEPLDTRALRTLAFARDPKALSMQSQTLAELGDRITRRDFFNQLILLQGEAHRHDPARAMRHFDAVLRIYPGSRPVVFALLNKGLSDPIIRHEVTRYLIEKSVWILDFVDYAGTTGNNSGLAADMVLAAGVRAPRAELEAMGPALLTRLLQNGEYNRALRLLSALPGGSKNLVDHTEWTAASTGNRFGLFAWQLVSEATKSGNFGGNAKAPQSSLYVYAAPGAQGPVATKILYLAHGAHIMRQTAEDRQSSAGDSVKWQMRCLTEGSSQPFWESQELLFHGKFKPVDRITVPANCGQQELALTVKGDLQQLGIDLLIDNFGVSPAQGAN